MKKFICLALTIFLMCALIGCFASADGENDHSNSARFVQVYHSYFDTIYVDTKTNVMYWVRSESHACDIQVMVDANGKPLLWEGR